MLILIRVKKNNLADTHPKIVNSLRLAYEKWWDSAIPLMVNEDLPKIKIANYPLVIRYKKQLEKSGIPQWSPDEI